MIKNFEDLEIWKESRRLTQTIYQLSTDSRLAKDFGLTGPNSTGWDFPHVQYRRGV